MKNDFIILEIKEIKTLKRCGQVEIQFKGKKQSYEMSKKIVQELGLKKGEKVKLQGGKIFPI